MCSSRANSQSALVASLVAMTVASSAHAQTSDKAVAEALFADARVLMSEHRYAEACAKFEESQALEPKLGTLLNMAACHEAIGRTASAWAEFTEGHSWAERVNQLDRASFAREHADRLAG